MQFAQFLLLSEIGQPSTDGLAQATTRYVSNGGQPDDALQSAAYAYLTIHDDRFTALQQQMAKNPEENKQARAQYRTLIERLNAAFLTIGWEAKENPAWVEWYKDGVSTGTKAAANMVPKRYVSIELADMWHVLQRLPLLGKALAQVRQAPGSVLGLKIATTYSGFIGHPDNIVIHYYDPQAKPQIDQAVGQFFVGIGKREADRGAIGRSQHGTDASGKSDSEMVAARFVRVVKANLAPLKRYLATDAAKYQQTLQSIMQTLMTQGNHRLV